jgi:hypothetical protein
MPLSFFMSEHFEGAASIMPRQLCANLERQRSHECERGTQECVRHNGFNTNYVGAPQREILSFFILDCSVVRFMPRRAAAPFGPPTTPLACSSTRRM